MNASREMPKYECHKKVWALKIKHICLADNNEGAELTPEEDASRGAQVGFRIHEHPSKKSISNQSTTGSGTAGATGTEIHTLAPGTSTPQASQRFCDFARKNNVILRYVAENNIHCVRVSTHYYNNRKDIQRFFEVLELFLIEEGWM